MTLEEAKMTIYANCIYACEKAGFDLSTICMVDDALRTVIAIADRKTENNSEKPNNSTISKMEQVEDEPQTDCGDFADRLVYERGVKHAWEVAQKVFSSTMTFYEAEDVAKQIDKDINVRSKTENNSEKPNNCDTCANGEGDIEACGYCRHGDLYEPKDEPQTDCPWK